MTEKNPVFEALGVDDENPEALTAYGLYKCHKRAWARDFERSRGRPPTVEEDLAFARAVATADQLARYRKNADDLLIGFASRMVEDVRPVIEQEAITVRIEQAAAQVEQRSSFARQVGQGLIATAINTFVLVMLALGIRLLGVDLLSVLSQLGQ
ncbi:hypothetical protein [Pedomonas mirosovicensis]|uniref:hypothetical protein n=1 Tax=Pedomonas mirosovicensis TaxID=2908641 RepID=UPI0021688388|nr:hypothetical protein [Pedomonas mirosovicensis]MCH8685743.1 hypothetical protein [Pedomonas mirosovicensis]